MKPTNYIYVVQVTRQLSIDIINEFVKKGMQVKLITGIVEPNYADLDPAVEVVYSIKYINTSGFKRIFTWTLFTIHSFFYILFKSKKNELIVVTTPPFVVFLGWIFNKIRNQRYHLIIWDLYPDVLVNFNVFKKSSLVIKVWNKLNKLSFDRAENIFTLGTHLKQAIMNYTNKEPVVVYNWTNVDFVKPSDRKENPFAKQYDLVDKFVVMYSGNLGVTHDVESIVHAAKKLEGHKQIQFVIVGGGAKKEKITKMVSDLKLTNVLLLPYQPREVLPFSLSCADIGVVTLGEGAESISVPSKTYFLLAAGSAILALSEKKSELGNLIERFSCGKVFDKASADEVGDFILELSKNKTELDRMKAASRQASFNFTGENAKLYYQYICK